MGGFASLLGLGQQQAPTVTPLNTDPITDKSAIDIARERRLLMQRQALNDRNSLIVQPGPPGLSPANGLFIPNPNA